MPISRTLGPIHFEDLDPHRFEDLVRELVYDFKDWQSIEATGRAGGDDGFDVRAYERIAADSGDPQSADDDVPHPMEGPLWMIQCKREKEIGPTRVASIIAEGVKADDPPYGYILAAPVNFSKKAFDTFRDELRKRGVSEFYLWGRAALEDMLLLPKNDHILFAFFGVSLVTKRRSRRTEIRSLIATKNKLLSLFEKDPRHEPVLFRDTKDTEYPFKKKYSDFDKRPRWKEYPVVEFHPRGMIVEVAVFFAYFDEDAKEWDYTDATNLKATRVDEPKGKDARANVESFWEHFPRRNRAYFHVRGLVPFDSIVAIDGEGDTKYDFPHVFADFSVKNGPFIGFYEHLRIGEWGNESTADLKRVKKFPPEFKAPAVGKVHREKTFEVSAKSAGFIKNYAAWLSTLYDADGKYGFLSVDDVIGIAGTQDKNGKTVMAKIMNKTEATIAQLIEQAKGDVMLKQQIEEQIGRNLDDSAVVVAYEFKRSDD